MNKKELIKAAAEASGQSAAATGEVLDAILATIKSSVAAGDQVALVGFGTFKGQARPARVGRNPANGQPIDIQASVVPKFVAGKEFKDSVNK